jgi:hypothetical protein
MPGKGKPFKKGNPGKPKGALSEKTIAWENIGAYLINEGAERAKKIMMDSDNKQFMVYFETLLEYFKPKLARQELTGKDGEKLKFNVTVKKHNE